MIQGPVSPTESRRRADCFLDVRQPSLDGGGQPLAVGETGRDRRGERTAGPMCAPSLDARTFPRVLSTAVPENIDQLVPSSVASLDQRRSSAHLHESAGCPPLILHAGNGLGREDRGLLEVWRDDRREGEELAGHGIDGVFVEQAVSARGDHDGIEHVGLERMRPDPLRDCADERGGRQHARLGGPGKQVGDDCIDLRTNDFERHRMHRAHPEGILSGDRGDRARTEDAERLEGLEVGLNSGASSTVAPRDREGDGTASVTHRRPYGWGNAKIEHLQDTEIALRDAPARTLSRSRQRLLRRISTRRGREAEKVVLLEGPRVISTAFQNNAEVLFVVREERERRESPNSRPELRIPPETEVFVVPADGLAEFSATESTQGVLAVARQPDLALPPAPETSGSAVPLRILVLDGVQDPGNAGALVRSAAAFGVERVLALEGTADLWGAKAVRSSAGLAFHLPVHMLDWVTAVAWLEATGVPLIVADIGGVDVRDWLREEADRGGGRPAVSGDPESRRRFSEAWALVVGNEAAGPRRELLDAADARVSIPLSRGVDSLNVASAGAVLLWALGPAREPHRERSR